MYVHITFEFCNGATAGHAFLPVTLATGMGHLLAYQHIFPYYVYKILLHLLNYIAGLLDIYYILPKAASPLESIEQSRQL